MEHSNQLYKNIPFFLTELRKEDMFNKHVAGLCYLGALIFEIKTIVGSK